MPGEFQSRGRNAGTAAAAAIFAVLATAAGAGEEDQPMPVPRLALGSLPPAVEAGEIIVTAQRREESEQRVPIAVSAFTQPMLEKAGIAGGSTLQLAIPNLSFSKDAFFGNNFQIRGIGTQVINTTADPSTSIHVNESPLVSNDLFEAEFYDLERVEVLRGPQGTLYGRNATGGVVNIVTAKPTGTLEGMGQVDIGNYSSDKVKGYVNLPLARDLIGLRLAGFLWNRAGTVKNQATGNNVDGRELVSGRATLAFTPADRLSSYVMWEKFNENDTRPRFAKAICTPDPGPTAVGGVPVDSFDRNLLSQGCKPTSIYGSDVFGAPNSVATLTGFVAQNAGLVIGNTNAAVRQSPDLRTINMWHDPSYRAQSDTLEWNLKVRPTEFLELTSIAAYARNNSTSRTYSIPVNVAFLNTAVSPGGLFNDPQIGASNLPLSFDMARMRSQQRTAELRLQSLLFGPVNFSLGVNYISYDTVTDYFFLSNEATAFAQFANRGAACPAAMSKTCIFIDPSVDPTGNGHNYYDNVAPYTLRSKAVFGDIYYNLLPDLKLTAGARYTMDEKSVGNYPIVLLVTSDAANGRQPGNPAVLRASFHNPTGRIGVDWQPNLPFTDRTLLYAFYSRGYKGGGINYAVPANAAAMSKPIFAPEIVNAYEVGAKNSFLENRVTLNLTAFFYGYRNYQITKIVNRANVTDNVDARVRGVELESTWNVSDAFHLDASAGLLNTSITTGSSIDTFNMTGGDPALTLVKNPLDLSNCVAPTSGVALIQSRINSGALQPGAVLGICSGAFSALGVTPSDGVPVNLKGKRLPNAPPWTVSLGGSYSLNLTGSWKATLRGDFYARGDSYARIYNTNADLIKGWTNTNAQLELANAAWNAEFVLYGTNLFNRQQITNSFLFDPAIGLTRDLFLLDPRTYGVTLRKRF